MSATETLLRIQYPTRRYVLSASRAQGSALDVFAPTHTRLPIGTTVRLAVGFGDSPQRFDLHGKVSYVRGGSYGISHEPGLGVTFESDDKRAASEMLAFCAGKPLSQGTASRKRVPTEINCRFKTGSHAVQGRVLDLSTSGLFVNSPKIPNLKIGSSIQVKLDPGWFGLGGQSVSVRIMWQGEKRGLYGFGGRFVDEPALITATLRKYMPAAP